MLRTCVLSLRTEASLMAVAAGIWRAVCWAPSSLDGVVPSYIIMSMALSVLCFAGDPPPCTHRIATPFVLITYYYHPVNITLACLVSLIGVSSLPCLTIASPCLCISCVPARVPDIRCSGTLDALHLRSPCHGIFGARCVPSSPGCTWQTVHHAVVQRDFCILQHRNTTAGSLHLTFLHQHCALFVSSRRLSIL